KVDAEDKDKRLEGAIFHLMDSEGRFVIRTAETDSNGVASFGSLLYDNYLLVEEEAPIGYVVDISQDGYPITIGEPETQITVENKKIKRHVELTKLDSHTRNTLAGAEFTLERNVDGAWEVEQTGLSV